MAICYAVSMNETGVPSGGPVTPKPIPTPPKPESLGWSLAWDPGRVVFDDNYWQLWKEDSKPGRFALCFRGTTQDPSSVWEDLRVRAKVASIQVQGTRIPLAQHPMARVHTGFADALAAILQDDALAVLERFATSEGMRELLVTGHSQGAALATLFRSFLEYQEVSPALRNIPTRTYAFAQPKPGNLHYAYDLEWAAQREAGLGPVFRVASDQDWVPQAPLTLQLPSDWSAPNPFTVSGRGWLKPVAWLMHLLRRPKFRMNYAPAGWPFILRGDPGVNPEAPNDLLWQHHPAQYFRLLAERFRTAA